MSDRVFYSAEELPHEFLSRAGRVAREQGDEDMASLFFGFAEEFEPHTGFGFIETRRAASWRDAKFTQAGRAVLALATRFTDIHNSKEAE